MARRVMRRFFPSSSLPEPFDDLARDGSPFEDPGQSAAWRARYCDRCAKEPDCVLLTAATLAMTPYAWRPERTAGDYTCTKFTPREAG